MFVHETKLFQWWIYFSIEFLCGWFSSFEPIERSSGVSLFWDSSSLYSDWSIFSSRDSTERLSLDSLSIPSNSPETAEMGRSRASRRVLTSVPWCFAMRPNELYRELTLKLKNVVEIRLRNFDLKIRVKRYFFLFIKNTFFIIHLNFLIKLMVIYGLRMDIVYSNLIAIKLTVILCQTFLEERLSLLCSHTGGFLASKNQFRGLHTARFPAYPKLIEDS